MTGISEELRPTCDGAWPIDGQMDCAGEQIVREICPSATELPDHRPDDRAQVAVYASLTRVIEGAPIQNKLAVFGLMAKTAAGEVAALRQRYIDDLWLVAGDIRLIDLLGTASVQATLCAAFDGPPMSAVLERQARNYASEDYDGLSGSFARAFREADRERRPVRRTSGKPVNGQLPESTRQAVEWLLKNKDAVRLNRFVAEHSLSDAQVIVAYIKRRQS